MESLRQELSEKQSLLSEAGEAIEQLENKIKLQEDLSKKVKECSGQYIKIYEIGFYTFIRTFVSLKLDKVVEGKFNYEHCRVITVTRTPRMLSRTEQELRTMSLKISPLTTLTR